MSEHRSVDSLAAWASGHETLCGDRHDRIGSRLDRIEKIVIGVFGTVIIGMAGLIWQLAGLAAKLPH